MPVARSAAKTIGRVARSAPIRSAGKAFKKEATKAAVETALEALEGQPVGRKAKQGLKSATRGILLNTARHADTNNEYRAQNLSRKGKTPSIAKSRKKKTENNKRTFVLKIIVNKRGFFKRICKTRVPNSFCISCVNLLLLWKKNSFNNNRRMVERNRFLHKQPKFPRPRNPTFAHQKRYQFQIDLIDLGNLIEENDGNRYLLTAIDIFTLFAFIEPLKNKTAKTFMEGFESIMKRAKKFPRRILADKGAEIKNKLFQAYCKNNNILLLHSNNFVHAPFVERFNRTLKNLMFKYMTHENTDRYIDALPLSCSYLQQS